jgi:hypothetical protein
MIVRNIWHTMDYKPTIDNNFTFHAFGNFLFIWVYLENGCFVPGVYSADGALGETSYDELGWFKIYGYIPKRDGQPRYWSVRNGAILKHYEIFQDIITVLERTQNIMVRI